MAVNAPVPALVGLSLHFMEDVVMVTTACFVGLVPPHVTFFIQDNKVDAADGK